jgi:fido (protein-threonine AMPylation protein)
MRPLGCPEEFEYKDHPRKAEVLTRGNAELFSWIQEGRIQAREAAADTRPFHLHLFKDLCPPGCSYFAGHYRGERYLCLQHYRVVIHGDPLVGALPEAVSGKMAELAVSIRAGIAGLDEAFKSPKVQLSAGQRVTYALAFACRVFVEFLTIHPYANGNGHLARFCLVAILARYGLILTGWSIDPSPPPPYAELIARHRRGEPHLLERAVLQNCTPI